MTLGWNNLRLVLRNRKEETMIALFTFGDPNIFQLKLEQSNGKLTYELKHNDKVMFSGNDYKPSPMYDPLSEESARRIIGFLSCRPGWDTDDEYFQDYTEEQKEFALRYGEEMSLWDYEPEPEPFLKAEPFLKSEYFKG